MRHAPSAFVCALLLGGATVSAQNATVTSTVTSEPTTATDTKVKSDNGKVVTMTGCVEIGGGTSYLLTNVTSEHEKDARQKSPGGPYALVARAGLDIGPYINQKVELTGVIVPAATKGDRDDKIELKETTTVKRENEPDKTSSEATTVKVARTADSQFLVASLKTLAPNCQQ